MQSPYFPSSITIKLIQLKYISYRTFITKSLSSLSLSDSETDSFYLSLSFQAAKQSKPIVLILTSGGIEGMIHEAFLMP